MKRVALASMFAGTMTLGLMAYQAPSSAPKTVPTVAVKALEALMPGPAGWEKVRSSGDQVTVSDSCEYTHVDATFAKDNMKVRVTLADTGFSPESLAILATLVVSFPDDYTNVVKPATTIARLKVGGFPAGSRWDDDAKSGELTVLVGGRFVANADGSHLDTLATLRTLLEQVDFKRLGELK